PLLLLASPPEIYTLSLHDALPISELGFDDMAAEDPSHEVDRLGAAVGEEDPVDGNADRVGERPGRLRGIGIAAHRVEITPQDRGDRKSTRLNSSHVSISYAVFCLK